MPYGTGVPTSAEQQELKRKQLEEEYVNNSRASGENPEDEAANIRAQRAHDALTYFEGDVRDGGLSKNYGGYQGGAADATQRYQTMGQQGVDVNQRDMNWSRGQQMFGSQLLRQAAMGNAPSQAEIMGRNMLDQSQQAQMSAAASSKGGVMGAMAAQQSAANAAAAQRQQGMGQLAALRADEMAKARAAYMAGSSTMRGMDAQQAFEQAKMNEQKQQYYENMGHQVQQAQLNANLGFASDATQNRAIARQEDADETAKWLSAAAAVGGTALMAFSDERTKYAYKPIPARAEGGPIDAGQPYLVGEQGPEIVVPQQGGTVIPNNMTGLGGAAVGNLAGTPPVPPSGAAQAGAAAGQLTTQLPQAERAGYQLGQIAGNAGSAAGHSMTSPDGPKPPESKGLNLGGAGKRLLDSAQSLGPQAGPPVSGHSEMVDKMYNEGRAAAERQLGNAPMVQSSFAPSGIAPVGPPTSFNENMDMLSDERAKDVVKLETGPMAAGLHMSSSGRTFYPEEENVYRGPSLSGPMPTYAHGALTEAESKQLEKVARKPVPKEKKMSLAELAAWADRETAATKQKTAALDYAQPAVSDDRFVVSDASAKKEAFKEGLQYAHTSLTQPKVQPKLPEYMKSYADAQAPAVRPMAVQQARTASGKDPNANAPDIHAPEPLPPPRPPVTSPDGNIVVSDDRAKLRAAFHQGAQWQAQTLQSLQNGGEALPLPDSYPGHRQKTVKEDLVTTSAAHKVGEEEEAPALKPGRSYGGKRAPIQPGQIMRVEAGHIPDESIPQTTEGGMMRQVVPGGAERRGAPMPLVVRANPAYASRKATAEELLQQEQAPSNIVISDTQGKLGYAYSDERTKEDANRKMKSSLYAYKDGFTPPEQQKGEMNYGPMAQELEKNPLTRTSVKMTPQGLRVVDVNKLVKVQAGAISNLQEQIDELRGHRR